MDWVTCPKCSFTQIPTEKCLRCGRPFDGPSTLPTGRRAVVAAASEPPSARAVPAPPLDPGPADDGPEARTVAFVLPPDPVAPGTGAAGRDGAGPAASKPLSPSPPAVEPSRAEPAFRPASAARRAHAVPPPRASAARTGRNPSAMALAIAGLAALALAVAILLLRSQAGQPEVRPLPARAAALAPAALDLSGRWETGFSKTLPGTPARPGFKQIAIETDREGEILSASVLLTDPGRGGAGAGYRRVQDGPERLQRAASALVGSPGGAILPMAFIPFPAWMPARERAWRALEGLSRKPADVRYLLLEAVEDDYVVQAGINRSGFLSYAFFSKEYARSRGLDALSAIIHPEAGSSLRGFRNLVWDLTGAADFLTLEVSATLSGPEGTMDRLVLKRAGGGKP